MARKFALLLLCLPLASAPSAGPAVAQGMTPVWPGPPGYRQQNAPRVYGGAQDYEDDIDYGRPLARPGRAARGYEDYGQPRRFAPPRGRPTAALPSDADPAYSTAVDYDSEIDWSEQTRASVADPTGGAPGSITVDTRARKLYLSLGGGRAIEYGIGVGREGFAWRGVAHVGRKAYWPGWTPPRDMLLRRPDLPDHMEGGIENPLGARALYLFKGSKDTLFRIHGTNEPDTIGKAVSSGCIRMLNADVVDLYKRVSKGARVVVL